MSSAMRSETPISYLGGITSFPIADGRGGPLAAERAVERQGLSHCRPPSLPTIRSSADGSPPPDKLGEDLMVCGNRLKRASPERWGPRKQEAFLAELTQTGNLRRACEAVRISRQAVDRRRHCGHIHNAQLDIDRPNSAADHRQPAHEPQRH